MTAPVLSFQLTALKRIVIDTNVLAGAMLREEGYNRRVMRACLENRLQPIIGQALFLEYEDVLGREALFRRSVLSPGERHELFEAFLSVCEWVRVYYVWRPNLSDEGDNHVIELAVAGGGMAMVTNNIADFPSAELRFPDLRVSTPKDFLREFS